MYADGCADRTVERHDACMRLYAGYIFTVQNDVDALFDTAPART